MKSGFFIREEIWTQPVMATDSGVGGSNFGVEATYTNSGAAWKAFDGNTSSSGTADCWRCTYSSDLPNHKAYIGFYNPLPLRVLSLLMYTLRYNVNGNSTWGSGVVTASNDGSTWTQVCSYSNSVTQPTNGNVATWSISVNATKAYKYWRIWGYTGISAGSQGVSGFSEIKINAIEHKSVDLNGIDVWAASSESKYYMKY